MSSLYWNSHFRRNHSAILNGDGFCAVFSSQFGFHCLFNAAFADGVIQIIALFGKLFVFLCIDRSNRSDFMRDDIPLCDCANRIFNDIHAWQR